MAEAQSREQTNIFVDMIEGRASAKVADFGLAVVSAATGVGKTATVSALKGTVAWLSPERFDTSLRITIPTDVYSFGMLGYTVMLVRLNLSFN
jgi:serine/threonine protein kinase